MLSDTFSLDKYYEISQAETCYPYPVTLTTGKKWVETAIGCERKCLFCNYSWTHKHRGNNQSDAGSAKTIWGASIESTIFQLDLDNPESWPRAGYMIFGIDGMSERLRRMVNKPITNEMLQRFLQGIPARYGNGKSHIIKWYNIIGYPTETDNDWQEMRDLMYRSSSPRVVKDSKIAKIHMHHTPYKSAPCTPTATWPVMYTNHRSILVERLQHENCQQYRYGLYAGTTVDFNATYATESLPTTAKWMIAFRGLESDTDFVRNLATSAFFNRSKTAEKIKWLEHNIDIFRFFDTYTWDTLPTRYLHTHTSDKKMALASDTLLCRYGGIEGIKLADKIAGR
ncbi:MAG: hypothetical protein ACW99U_19740 [Candidatus Thorarchaeota archaeon]|jgi:hypothetical protein